MRKPYGALAFAVAALAARGPSRGDVVLTESMASKVERSAVLALAQFAGTEGTGTSSSGAPPAARFLVTRAIRGCAPGELVKAPAPDPLPALGTEAALLLGGRRPPAGLHVPFPEMLLSPSARDVELLLGFATFRADVAVSGDLEVRPGDPVAISLTLANDGPRSARFDFATLRLTTSTPGGTGHVHLPPASSAGSDGLLAVDLEPGERKDLSWNLARLYPGLFVEPGDYWLDMEAPARGADRITRHVEVVEPSLAYACGRAPVILRSRVAPKAGDPSRVTLVDPIVLRLRGPRPPATATWPPGTAIPAPGTRVILCGNDSRISRAEADTVENRQRVKELILSEQGDPWPPEEGLDPRFAPPPGAELPASELRRIGLERRLAAP